jgi:hypothetical protein
MISIYILFLFGIIKSLEVCKGPLIAHDLFNCFEEIQMKRRSMENMEKMKFMENKEDPPPIICPNLGTWGCSSFICEFQFENGTCTSGYINHQVGDYECCTQHNIRYIDFWFTPQEEDWDIEIYDYDIHGEGSDITIEGQLFQNLYNFIGQKTFISIILDGYCDGMCYTNFSLLINASLAITHNTNKLNIYSQLEARNIFELHSKENQQQISKFSARTIIPSLEQIEYLFGLGCDGPAFVELWYDDDETRSSCGGMVSSGYRTATIILGIALGILALLLALFLIWWLYRFFTGVSMGIKGEPYEAMKEY